MTVRIEPASVRDVDTAVAAYHHAWVGRLARGGSAWPEFSVATLRGFVETGQLFCAREADALMAVFVVLDDDPAIWGGHDGQRYLYLHHTAPAEACLSPGVFEMILDWTRARCRALGGSGIRIDAWADNGALVRYYEDFGFRIVRTRVMASDPRLPPNLHGVELALLEQGVSGHGEERATVTVLPRRHWFDRSFPPGRGLEELAEIVERLRGTPARLEERVAALPGSVLTRRPDGRWSVQEHVGHLLDLEALWMGRLDDFETGAPALRPADLANRATHEAAHNERSVTELLARFRARRTRLVQRVERLPIPALRRAATHPRLLQPMTIVDLCCFAAEHDDHHLATITQLSRAPVPSSSR